MATMFYWSGFSTYRMKVKTRVLSAPLPRVQCRQTPPATARGTVGSVWDTGCPHSAHGTAASFGRIAGGVSINVASPEQRPEPVHPLDDPVHVARPRPAADGTPEDVRAQQAIRHDRCIKGLGSVTRPGLIHGGDEVLHRQDGRATADPVVDGDDGGDIERRHAVTIVPERITSSGMPAA